MTFGNVHKSKDRQLSTVMGREEELESKMSDKEIEMERRLKSTKRLEVNPGSRNANISYYSYSFKCCKITKFLYKRKKLLQ